jgi:hypothetical protein
MICYDKKVDFNYSPSGHRYTVAKRIDDGKAAGQYATPQPVAGITTITSIISKEALVYWSAKISAYYMRDKLLEARKAKKSLGLNALAEEAKVAHTNEKEKSAGIGTVGHKMIETLLLGKEVVMPKKPELLEAIKNIRLQHDKFEADFEPETIHVETPMYSLFYNFAGTDDRFCKIGDKKIVIDYKTQNRSSYNPDGIYASNFAQLGGQAILIEEMFGETIDDCWIVNFAKDSEDYKYRSLSSANLTVLDAKLYFINCLNLYNVNQLFEWRIGK